MATQPPSSLVPSSQSAASLLASLKSAPRASSGCSSLDALLSPKSSSTFNAKQGLEPGSVLELMGPPGVGKSRCCLGFALVQRFAELEKGGGRGGQVLVVDAEGSLSPTLIEATAQLYAAQNSLPKSSVKSLCEGIHYESVNELAELVAFFYALPNWLFEHPQVTLVILDSLSFHLRPSTVDHSTRMAISTLIQQTLATITSVHSVSMILTTQLTLKLFLPTGEPSSFNSNAEALLVPPLGDSWIKGPTWRICLYYGEGNTRHASLVDSHVPSREKHAEWMMGDLGPCDVPQPDE